MITKTYTDIQHFQKALNKLQKLTDLLEQARGKYERIREGNFYLILGKEQQQHDLKRANLVVLRLHNRINVLSKQLTL